MSREVLAEGQYLRFIKDHANHWEFVERTGPTNEVVIIIAVTPDNELLMVEQYRPPVRAPVIELPAGLVGDITPDETTKDSAFRELEEETGYQAAHMELVNRGPLSPGGIDEIAAIYYATGLTQIHEGGGDETEDITVHSVALTKIDFWLENQKDKGMLVDPKIYTALYFISKKHKP